MHMRTTSIGIRYLALAATAMMLSSCATETIAPGADRVRLTYASSDVAGCKVVGNVSGVSGSGKNERVSETLLRNRTVGLDGNTVLVTLAEHPVFGPVVDREGVAYRCPG